MDGDIKLQDGTVEVVGDKFTADVGFKGGTVALTGSNFKTAVTDVEMLYYGGHLRAQGGNLEMGSTDSGTFKGFSQARDGSVQVTGDKVSVSAGSVEIGLRSGGKFKGWTLSAGGLGCYGAALMVVNPDAAVGDGRPRIALAQSAADELLINAGGHYEGGAKVEGRLAIKGEASCQSTFRVEAGGKLLLMAPGKVVKLPNGKTLTTPPLAVDALQTLQELQDTVRQLQDRIAALEAR